MKGLDGMGFFPQTQSIERSKRIGKWYDAGNRLQGQGSLEFRDGKVALHA